MHPPRPTRFSLLLALSLACPAPLRAEAHEVRQISDPLAHSPAEMFRYSPPLLRAAPGARVRFVNSMAGHTVHTIPELWPEGAPPVHLSYRPEAEVQFAQPGIYGLICRRHGTYGMVMLVAVGKNLPLEAARAGLRRAHLSDDARANLTALLNELETTQ